MSSELIRSVTGESKLSNDDIDLMTAVFLGKTKDLKPILERAANIVYNNTITVKFLVENGADMNLKNINSENALYLANLTCDKPVISTLIAKGAKKGCLSLHIEFFVT